MSEQTSTPRLNRRLILQRYPIDGQAVKRLMMAGMTWLKTNKAVVNALNVFPVPDGDTGTNMVLTMESAQNEIENLGERHAGKMLSAIAQGALMGARGNSGVILSQIWRGIANELAEVEHLTAKNLAKSFANARDTAYKGVVRPVEGTILTVVKDVAAACEKAIPKTEGAIGMLEVAMNAAAVSVEHTPELLPVLKEAGVVDSGGKGFFFILEGMIRWVNGERLDTPIAHVQELSAMHFDSAMDEVEEGQDYEVVVDFRPNGVLDLQKFYGGLENLGTSIQVGEGEGMYRMHIHVPTENLYKPIDYCMELGTITDVVIENLMAQMEDIGAAAHDQIELIPIEPDQIAVVAVSPGQGFSKIFASLEVGALIEGGQTMNPSTQQIMEAFENMPTNKIVILPNNKNITMAAEAAAELSVKEVRVVRSRTVPQGISAMLRLAKEGELDKVVKEMEAAMDEVVTGEITTATRTVEIDGVEVKSGEIIGLHNGKLVLSAKSLEEGCIELLKKIEMDDYELVTLFYGKDTTSDEVDHIAKIVEENYPDHEVEVQDGGQAHYQFVFSIE